MNISGKQREPLFSKILFIYFYTEGKGEEGREKEREGHIDVWLSLAHPSIGDLARNPGMCPDYSPLVRNTGDKLGLWLASKVVVEGNHVGMNRHPVEMMLSPVR